jgi:hypothetical protein
VKGATRVPGREGVCGAAVGIRVLSVVGRLAGGVSGDIRGAVHPETRMREIPTNAKKMCILEVMDNGILHPVK